MPSLLYSIQRLLHWFEAWFERRFGWFLTNGMKETDASRRRAAQEREQRSPPTA